MAENLRYARLELEDGRRVFVEVVGDEAFVLTEAPWLRRTPTGERVRFLGGWARGELHAGKPKLLAPVVPSKILCVGRNYRAHAKELGNEVPVEPMIFYKPPSAILDPDGAIALPPTSISSRVEHEAELGVVIGRRVRNATLEEATSAVFGLTLACGSSPATMEGPTGQKVSMPFARHHWPSFF